MKKDKREIAKRRARATERTRKKRKVRLMKAQPGAPRIMERPPISHVEAPKGFMTVSSSQALKEYAKPLMETDAGSLDERTDPRKSRWKTTASDAARAIRTENRELACNARST